MRSDQGISVSTNLKLSVAGDAPRIVFAKVVYINHIITLYLKCERVADEFDILIRLDASVRVGFSINILINGSAIM